MTRLVRARLWLVVGLLSFVSPPTLAALFKCVVNGKTTYQQSACAAVSDTDSSAAPMKTLPAPNQGGTTTTTAEGVGKRKVKLVDEGTPVAKAAFGMLVDGKIDAYVANLCPRERKNGSNPSIKESLRDTSLDLAKRKAVLGRIIDSGLSDLSFVALEKPDGHLDISKPIKTIKVVAHFEWDLGKICLRTMTVTNN